MLTRINKHRDEAGFTLIELLVVVIIIGILAAIAIPVFLNQRNSARNASAESDARNLAIAMESVYTEKGVYPADGTFGVADGATKSQGNFADIKKQPNGSFVISTCNAETDKVIFYDSAAGGVVATPVGTPTWTDCPTGDTTAATASVIAVSTQAAA